MAEEYPSDAAANALNGTTDSDTGAVYGTTGDNPWYTWLMKFIWHLLLCFKRAGDLRVYKDGDLTFGVRAGLFLDGDTARNFSAVTAQSLTDDETNYIYITAAGTLTKNTTGFPNPSTTPHIPLATIVCASGEYDHDDVTDYRGRGMLGVCDALTGALANEAAAFFDGTDIADTEAETLTDGSNADSLHVHGAAGLEAGSVAVSELATAVEDLLPNLNITAGAESSDTRAVTIQARDAGDNNLAQRVLVRLWIDDAEYGAPDATGNTVGVTTGTTIEAITANAYYVVESDASGTVVFDLTVSGAASRYVMAEIDGRIYSSGELTFAA